MSTVLERLRARWKLIAIATGALLLLLPVLGAGVIGPETELQVNANAPQRSDALHINVGLTQGLTSDCDGTAQVEVLYEGIIAYPRVLGDVPIRDCKGTLEIPYAKFAASNGLYEVRAYYDGMEAETRVLVEKVVNWVYVRSFAEPEQERVRVDVALDTIRSQPLSSSVFASGTLVLDIVWEQCTNDGPLGIGLPDPTQECQAQGDNVFHAEVPITSRASAIIFIPWKSLESPKFDGEDPEEGWYNVTAVFHN
ncbi:MAG: hypothetical protein R3185_08160, partial [Candidatus Thermoplasmatota archaeon]|nr:hypothetical protein [Candidatus Thermoplasmatota archaeon]